MKTFRNIIIGMTVGVLTGCDLVEPDEIVNPNVDEKTFLDSDNPMETWLNGTEKQLALDMSDFVELMEILSDNYFNGRSLSVYINKLRHLLEPESGVRIVSMRLRGYKLLVP